MGPVTAWFAAAARNRERRARTSEPGAFAVVLLIALVVTARVASALAGSAPTSTTRSCGNESLVGSKLGHVAYVRGVALRLLDLGTCRERVLARRAAPPVHFSADGPWVLFGAGRVVASAGGPVLRPLPSAAAAWAWAPRGHRLAGVTRGGGVVIGGPGLGQRRLVVDGWGAQQLLYTVDGSLAVARSRYPRARRQNYNQEIWLFAGPRLTPKQVLHLRRGLAPPELAAWSRDGGSLFYWLRPQNSASLSADGLPLYVTGTASGAPGQLLARSVLAYDDFLSWCGDRLVIAAGGGRSATQDKFLLVASRPPRTGRWRTRNLSRDRPRSWISPACSPDRRTVAAAAGPNRREVRLSRERRGIWRLALDGSKRRQLTTAPQGFSDELPRWSTDGRAILFVRSGPTRASAQARGALYAVPVTGGRPFGPLADLGQTSNYYGHFGWVGAFDWTP